VEAKPRISINNKDKISIFDVTTLQSATLHHAHSPQW